MNPDIVSRRRFLQSASSLAGASYLKLLSPAVVAITQSACTAKEGGAPFKVLSGHEAADLAAIAARIIPTTDTPGATEAGVIYFFDSAFESELGDQLDAVREWLPEFNKAVGDLHPGAAAFSDLGESEQDAFLRTQESTEFFNLVRVMTMFGFFSMPKYGGNKDYVGWDLVGFEGHHGGWEYPFGYYDAQVHTEAKDVE
jgi:gluconate 2-dehydrogenase gamma chain